MALNRNDAKHNCHSCSSTPRTKNWNVHEKEKEQTLQETLCQGNLISRGCNCPKCNRPCAHLHPVIRTQYLTTISPSGTSEKGGKEVNVRVTDYRSFPPFRHSKLWLSRADLSVHRWPNFERLSALHAPPDVGKYTYMVPSTAERDWHMTRA